MPYTIFALKWRPQNFDEIVGQKDIVARLKGAFEKQRLGHAYLFTGPRGVGKTSTARILAKALNCKDGPTLNPCGKCTSCLEITKGRSLDVIEIDGASNRGIEEIRALRENVKFAPTLGKFKVYIIDEVHMLTPEAFNALLKTLEEPPEFVKFIFATTHPNKVIPTILSRCQRFDFRRIPLMEIISQLKKITHSEKIDIDEDILLAIAKASDGSLRDAESILDQLFSFTKDKVLLEDVISILGVVEEEVLFDLTDKIIQKDALATLELFNKIIEQGKDISVFLINLIEHFRNLMIAKISHADPKLIDLPQDICRRLLEQSQNFNLEELFSAFNILVNTQEMQKRIDSLRIPLEISLVKLSHDKKGEALNIDKTVPNFKSETPKLSIKAEPLNKKSEAEHKSQDSIKDSAQKDVSLISIEDIKEKWQEAIEGLGKIKISVSTYLTEGLPLKVEQNMLTVSFPKDYSLHKESLERKENKALIEKTFSDFFNKHIRVNFILSKEDSRKEEIADNSFLNSALNAFRGRVIREE